MLVPTAPLARVSLLTLMLALHFAREHSFPQEFAMFGLFQRSAPPPQNDGLSRRSRLRVEALEDRTVPSVVYDQTFNWSNMFGNATVHVTVTEAAPNGDDEYIWNYALTNDGSNYWDFEMLALPNKDPNDYGLDAMAIATGNFGGDQEGWSGEPYGSPSRPIGATDEYLYWSNPDGLQPGGSVNLSFTTAPTTITTGTGLVSQFIGGFANTIMGTIAAPTVADPHIVTTKSDTGTIDDGLVSLREAVDYTLKHQDKGTDVTFAINGPITLDPSKGTIALGSFAQAQTINIAGPQTIQRSGEVQGIFSVGSMATVGLNQLTLINGKSNLTGGAIATWGNLTVTSCTFSSNQAVGGNGGAISAGGGSLTINGTSANPTQFTGNSARWGGAIYVAAGVTANINWSDLVANSADMEGGAIFIESSSGQNYTTVTLTNSDVNENTAYGSRGGGIMVSSSTGAGTSLTLNATQIRNNVVSGANSKGGGVFFGAGIIGLFGVTISDNEANTGDGIYSVTGTAVNPFSIYTLTNDTWDWGPY